MIFSCFSLHICDLFSTKIASLLSEWFTSREKKQENRFKDHYYDELKNQPYSGYWDESPTMLLQTSTQAEPWSRTSAGRTSRAWKGTSRMYLWSFSIQHLIDLSCSKSHFLPDNATLIIIIFMECIVHVK